MNLTNFKNNLKKHLLSVILLLSIPLLLIGVWIYSGQPIENSPLVIIQSGSMMHCQNGAGHYNPDECEKNQLLRLNSPDPGDLVINKKANNIYTYAENKNQEYQKPGTVIIYYPNGNQAITPIIHRAMFNLIDHQNGTYSIPELNLQYITTLENTELLTNPDYGVDKDFLQKIPSNNKTGIITKGDNNPIPDQYSLQPVKPEWILGVAAGEIPGLGSLKLGISDLTTGSNFYSNIPTENKIIFYVFLALIFIPQLPLVKIYHFIKNQIVHIYENKWKKTHKPPKSD